MAPRIGLLKSLFPGVVVLMFVFALAALGASPARAQDHIDPLPPEPHPLIQRDLTLTDMRVSVLIDGSVARTTIRQTLRNDGRGMAEGRYLLPLPPGADVSDFAIIDGDQRLEGEVLDADEAQQVYQDIVRQMRDPGLLEYQDNNTFSVAVFPFNPGDERTIEVKFNQTIGGTTELLSYSLPLKWADWSYCRNVSFVLDYEIESPHELGTISSPTHPVSVQRDGDYRAEGSYEATVSEFSNDFVLHIGRRTGDFAASLLCFPGDGGEDGYFLLSLLAALPEREEYVPKDVVFIIDRSGSMAGEKMEQAKAALKFVLDRLKSEDRFGFISYDDVIEPLWDELRIANKDNLREARDAASRLFDRGSTDIDAALKEGARLIGAGKERPKYVIFLTDGLPTAGVEDIGEIVDNARDRMPESVKLFVFGVGYDVNTTLLDSLSYNHHGSATYVTEGESIEAKVSEFYSRISSPALVDIAVELDGLDTYDVMPRQLPDLFHNHELFITGRFSGEPTRSVNLSVSGSHGNNKQVLEARVDSNYSKKHNTIPRLWATRKVSYLLDQVRLHGDDQELIDQIDRLAMRYGIVTPYTSYLITEPDQFFDEGERQQMLVLEMEEAREDDTGAASVNRSKINQQNQAAGQAAAPAPSLGYADGLMDEESTDGVPAAVNYVNNQTFVRQSVADSEDYQWVDARFEKDEQQVVQITAYSEVYFELVTDYPELGDYLSQGDYVIVVIGEDLVLEITADEVSNTDTELEQVRDALADGSYLT